MNHIEAKIKNGDLIGALYALVDEVKHQSDRIDDLRREKLQEGIRRATLKGLERNGG